MNECLYYLLWLLNVLSFNKDSSIPVFYLYLFLNFYPIHLQFIFTNGTRYKAEFFHTDNQLCQHHHYINHFNDICVIYITTHTFGTTSSLSILLIDFSLLCKILLSFSMVGLEDALLSSIRKLSSLVILMI